MDFMSCERSKVYTVRLPAKDYKYQWRILRTMSTQMLTHPKHPNVPFVDLGAQYRDIASEINDAIAKVIQEADFILGHEVRLFEEEFAAFCDARHAVGVDSGTSAL